MKRRSPRWSGVAGPDGRTPLPQSGALSGLVVAGDKIYVTIAVAPEQAKASEPMRLAAEQALKALPGIAAAYVGADRRARAAAGRSPPASPWPSPRRRAPASTRSSRSSPSPRARAASASPPPPPISRWRWRRSGKKVGLLDADVFGPSAAAAVRPVRQAELRRRRQEPRTLRQIWRQADVDRLPGAARTRPWSGAARW